MFNYVVNGKVVDITLENGKVVKASTEFLNKMCDNLDIDFDEAVNTWLEDEDYLVNDEQKELTEKAKEHKELVGAKKAARTTKKTQKERVVKENPTKELVITKLFEAVSAIDGATDVVVENKAKLITFKLNGEDFKIDLVQKRKAKGE
jgi:hypothetical protein